MIDIKKIITQKVTMPRMAIMLSGLVLAFAGTSANAQTDTFAVTTTVSDVCSVTANDMGFGTYDPLSATNNDATTTLDVTCTLTTAYDVGLDAGTGTGGTTTTRVMESATDALNYTMWQNVTRTTNWGNAAGTDTVAGTGTGAAQTLTVYGRIAALQAADPGAYTDTVTVTVTF